MTKKKQPEPTVYGVLDSDGLVVNVIMWDGVTAFDHDYELVEIGDQYAGIGFRWTGSKFVDERPRPEPEEDE
jgi:hypothetical protein